MIAHARRRGKGPSGVSAPAEAKATMSRFNSTLPSLVFAAVACGLLAPAAAAEERMVIHSDDAKRRTCPSEQCGIIGRFFSGESVVVYESADGGIRGMGQVGFPGRGSQELGSLRGYVSAN